MNLLSIPFSGKLLCNLGTECTLITLFWIFCLTLEEAVKGTECSWGRRGHITPTATPIQSRALLHFQKKQKAVCADLKMAHGCDTTFKLFWEYRMEGAQAECSAPLQALWLLPTSTAIWHILCLGRILSHRTVWIFIPALHRKKETIWRYHEAMRNATKRNLRNGISK